MLLKYLGITSVIALCVIPSNGTGPVAYFDVFIVLLILVSTPNIFPIIPLTPSNNGSLFLDIDDKI